MTPDERQALRDKHRPRPKSLPVTCAGCDPYESTGTEYPCDAIKLLDQYELLLEALGGVLYRE